MMEPTTTVVQLEQVEEKEKDRCDLPGIDGQPEGRVMETNHEKVVQKSGTPPAFLGLERHATH